MRRLLVILGIVAACGGPASSQLINCPLALDDGTGSTHIVAMSQSERQAFSQVRAFALQQSGGDRAAYLSIVGDALVIMADRDDVPPSSAKRRSAGTRVDPHPSGERSAYDIVEQVKQRHVAAGTRQIRRGLERGAASSVSGAITGGPAEDRWSVERPTAELQEELAIDGFRPRTRSIIGQPVQGPVFVSSIAIVDPVAFDDPAKRWSIDKRPICSATRIGRDSILTAAHCVCDLDLDRTVQEVRIGFNVNPEGRAVKAKTVPGRTRCYPGAGGGSEDCAASFCDAYRAAGRSVQPSHYGKDLAIVAIDGGPVDSQFPQWSGPSTVAGASFYRNLMASGHQRSFVLGYGFDPTVVRDAGLGIKRCAQMVAGATCGPDTDFECDGSIELTLKGDPGVSALSDACPGDSGGGAFVMDGTGASRRFLLAGVVSRGPRYDGPLWQQCGRKGSIYSFAANSDAIDWMKRALAAQGEVLNVQP